MSSLTWIIPSSSKSVSSTSSHCGIEQQRRPEVGDFIHRKDKKSKRQKDIRIKRQTTLRRQEQQRRPEVGDIHPWKRLQVLRKTKRKMEIKKQIDKEQQKTRTAQNARGWWKSPMEYLQKFKNCRFKLRWRALLSERQKWTELLPIYDLKSQFQNASPLCYTDNALLL